MQAIPAGFLQEWNHDLMEDLWFALAAAKHPETFDECDATLEDVFEHHLADVTWEDFWKAFPYELRCVECNTSESSKCLEAAMCVDGLLASHSTLQLCLITCTPCRCSCASTSGVRAC